MLTTVLGATYRPTDIRHEIDLPWPTAKILIHRVADGFGMPYQSINCSVNSVYSGTSRHHTLAQITVALSLQSGLHADFCIRIYHFFFGMHSSIASNLTITDRRSLNDYPSDIASLFGPRWRIRNFRHELMSYSFWPVRCRETVSSLVPWWHPVEHFTLGHYQSHASGALLTNRPTIHQIICHRIDTPFDLTPPPSCGRTSKPAPKGPPEIGGLFVAQQFRNIGHRQPCITQ
jgi:hypothetical protein